MNIDSRIAAVQPTPPVSAAPARRTRAPKRKTRITIYLDDDVLDEFRSLSERCGTGYQTLINAALRKRLSAHTAESAVL